jgi:hypothetical protein
LSDFILTGFEPIDACGFNIDISSRRSAVRTPEARIGAAFNADPALITARVKERWDDLVALIGALRLTLLVAFCAGGFGVCGLFLRPRLNGTVGPPQTGQLAKDLFTNSFTGITFAFLHVGHQFFTTAGNDTRFRFEAAFIGIVFPVAFEEDIHEVCVWIKYLNFYFLLIFNIYVN